MDEVIHEAVGVPARQSLLTLRPPPPVRLEYRLGPLLLGTVGLFDLRVLGLAKGIPPATLHRLIPFGIGGYLVNVLTGIVFFSGHPDQYFYNNAFRTKLIFMAVAGTNVLLFYGTNAFEELKKLPSGVDPPLRIKLIAGTSLCMWVGVLVCGRLITFFRPPFFH